MGVAGFPLWMMLLLMKIHQCMSWRNLFFSSSLTAEDNKNVDQNQLEVRPGSFPQLIDGDPIFSESYKYYSCSSE